MAVEVVLSLALAGGVLWLVLSPLFRPGSIAPDVYEPPDPTETRKGAAVAALKEIDYDGYLCAEALAVPDSMAAAQRTMDSYRELFPA